MRKTGIGSGFSARSRFGKLIRTVILIYVLHLDTPCFFVGAVKIKKFNFHIFAVSSSYGISVRLGREFMSQVIISVPF